MEEHELYGMTLRRLRRTLGLTQKELGERCGLSASGIGMLERGLRLPSSKAQRRLRALLPTLPPRPKKPVNGKKILTGALCLVLMVPVLVLAPDILQKRRRKEGESYGGRQSSGKTE